MSIINQHNLSHILTCQAKLISQPAVLYFEKAYFKLLFNPTFQTIIQSYIPLI